MKRFKRDHSKLNLALVDKYEDTYVEGEQFKILMKKFKMDHPKLNLALVDQYGDTYVEYK